MRRLTYDQHSIRLPRQYLPQSHGGICNEGPGGEGGAGIASAATSREEIGNPVYPPAQRKLAEHGIGCAGHAARQITARDYQDYDLLIAMDSANLRNMRRFYGGDPAGKIHMLLEYAGRPGEEVADPWYTGDFEATWEDVSAGCAGLLEQLTEN